jgi:catechol 2,3-dioxygenase-like lactoylglutathione lyase family enzyme
MRIGNVTFDCADPDRMSTFWAAALGYEKRTWTEELRKELLAAGLTDDDLAGRGLAEDPAGVGPRLFFQRVPESKLRDLSTDEQLLPHVVHLDINVGNDRKAEHHEIDAEVQRLVGLGATVIRKHDQAWGRWPEYHYVMADPEGHVFCLQ